jgi:hypothetical protein
MSVAELLALAGCDVTVPADIDLGYASLERWLCGEGISARRDGGDRLGWGGFDRWPVGVGVGHASFAVG